MTGREAMKKAARMLDAAGREDAERAARLLLEESLGVSTAGLIQALGRDYTDDVLKGFMDMAGRAAAGEPVQYILGRWDFYGYSFKCDSRALVPRPETERLVEAVLAAMPKDETLDVMDAGAGTGCIGITIKLKRSASRVVLCDISRDALSLARENADALHADVTLLEADMRLPFPGGLYDVIVSNPPYINAADMKRLSTSISEYEPYKALYGGEDGLDFVRVLVLRAEDSLKPQGRLFVEIGYDQADRALELMKTAGLEACAIPDYSGILRVISARKV
jgi:release factor glutamine methyltransferase